MIDNSIVEGLKTFIKKHYKMRGESLSALIPFMSEMMTHTHYMMPQFEDVANDMNSYIKNKRNAQTFTVMLEKFREERNMTAPQLYEGAGMDRRHYSRIMGNRHYHPLKNSVLALGLSLKLSREEMNKLLAAAGYSLRDNSIADLVIMYCLEKGIYEVMDVNALLVTADQKVLCRE